MLERCDAYEIQIMLWMKSSAAFFKVLYHFYIIQKSKNLW